MWQVLQEEQVQQCFIPLHPIGTKPMVELSEKRNCNNCKKNEIEIGKQVYCQSADSYLCQDCLDRENQVKIDAYSAKTLDPSAHLYNRKMVCPHCGHENEPDCEDYNLNGDERDCGNCESVFSCTTHVEVTYSTSKS